MEMENSILNQIAERFPSADKENAKVTPRRIYVSIARGDILDVLKYCYDELGFTFLCAITGLDTGTQYEFLYHISDENGILLTVKYATENGDGVVIPSVLPIYHGATFYEREVEGLFGVKIDGLPEGRQYPLPDNWPKGEYPGRKNWVPFSARPKE